MDNLGPVCWPSTIYSYLAMKIETGVAIDLMRGNLTFFQYPTAIHIVSNDWHYG